MQCMRLSVEDPPCLDSGAWVSRCAADIHFLSSLPPALRLSFFSLFKAHLREFFPAIDSLRLHVNHGVYPYVLPLGMCVHILGTREWL